MGESMDKDLSAASLFRDDTLEYDWEMGVMRWNGKAEISGLDESQDVLAALERLHSLSSSYQQVMRMLIDCVRGVGIDDQKDRLLDEMADIIDKQSFRLAAAESMRSPGTTQREGVATFRDGELWGVCFRTPSKADAEAVRAYLSAERAERVK